MDVLGWQGEDDLLRDKVDPSTGYVNCHFPLFVLDEAGQTILHGGVHSAHLSVWEINSEFFRVNVVHTAIFSRGLDLSGQGCVVVQVGRRDDALLGVHHQNGSPQTAARNQLEIVEDISRCEPTNSAHGRHVVRSIQEQWTCDVAHVVVLVPLCGPEY